MIDLVLAIACWLQAPDVPRVELPPGRGADAIAQVTADTKPVALPAVPPNAWDDAATWKRWAELLTAEASATTSSPSRRAELALLALTQDRYDDAWARLAECAAEPQVVAALLPRFLPGAEQAGPLPEGAVLAPAMPPSSGAPPRGRVERRSMRAQGLRVGDAVLAMKVSVESEGVEIELEHLSGEPVKLSVSIPADPQFDFSDEYVDWYRQERRGVPHELSIQPGDEPHTLYARFEPRAAAWPTLLPENLPEQISGGGLWLVLPDSGADRALLEAVAEALRRSPLHLAASVKERGRTGEEISGTAIDLSDPALRPRKLAWIAGSIERLALRIEGPLRGGRSR